MFGMIQKFINKLLPFATPGTPLIQDLLHLAALCTALYYAPQIQSWYQTRTDSNGSQQETQVPEDAQSEIRQGLAPQPDANTHIPRPAAVEDDDGGDDDSDASDADADGPLFPADAEGNPNFDGDAEPGPAAGPRPTGSSRTVGAKKAKSLARKDQRRAYHEFMRSQGEAQRARDAEGAGERDAVLAEERARRAAAVAEVEARRSKEREAKREREVFALREEMARRERAVGLVRASMRARGVCDVSAVAEEVGGGADRVWVEKLVRASGLLKESRYEGSVVMLTELGWVVEVAREDMAAVYAAVLEGGKADAQGRVPTDEVRSTLKDAVLSNAKVTAT